MTSCRFKGMRICVIIAIVELVIGETILELIELNPNLQSLKFYIDKLGPAFAEQLNDVSLSYTFFAPVNSAFDSSNLPKDIYFTLSSQTTTAKSKFANYLQNHAVYTQTPLRLADMADTQLSSTSDGQPSLFVRREFDEMFVNGAKILTELSDLEASNGIVHLIDSFLYDIALQKSAAGLVADWSQNTDRKISTYKFNDLLMAYKNEFASGYYQLDGLKNHYLTMFVPIDEYLYNIPTLNQLKAVKSDLKKVVESHIIIQGSENVEGYQGIFHTPLLERAVTSESFLDGIPAMANTIKPKTFGNSLYVSNDCAQGVVTLGNVTVRNGVVHLINGMMGYLYYDAFSLIGAMDELREFEGYVNKASPQVIESLQLAAGAAPPPETERFTIFAPINEAFSLITTYTDLTQRADLDTVIKEHMMLGMLSSSEISNTTTRSTLQAGSQIKFYSYGEDTWVEVNHVRGRITHADVCVKNGIVHYVDHVLGVPYLTVLQAIEADDRLTNLYSLVRLVAMDEWLNDVNDRVTFFAPTNEALQIMRQSEFGRDWLNPTNANRPQTLIKRHLIRDGEFYLDNIADETQFETEGGISFTVKKENNYYVIYYGGMRINVIEQDIRMLNGVMNIIDFAFFENTRLDFELIGNDASSVRGYNLFLLFTMLGVHYIYPLLVVVS